MLLLLMVHWSLRHMKHSLQIVFFLLTTTLHAQEVTQQDSITLDSDINCLCANLRNEIFVGQSNGEVVIISGDDRVITERFSYPNLGPVSKITCANPLKVFVFFEDTQRYIYLDRFSVRPTIYNVQEDLSQRIDFLELSADQSLWSISAPSLVLHRHFHSNVNEIYLLQSILTDDESILGLHAIGNQMLLQSDKNLYYFNIAGQLTHAETGIISDINISMDMGYFISSDNRLLSSLKSDNIALPQNEFNAGIKVGNILLLSKKNKLYFYSIR
jgi:hypothetical protein